MKILYLGTSDFPGGGAAGRCMHMVSKGLVNIGHEVTVLMGRRISPGPSNEIIDGIKVVWSSRKLSEKPKAKLRKMLYTVKSRVLLAIHIFRFLAIGNYDWVISYTVGVEIVIPLAIASRCCGVKIASQYGDIWHRDSKTSFVETFSFKLGQLLGAKTSHLILNSGSKNLEKQFRKLSPNSNIAQLLPPVDTGIFLSAHRGTFRDKHKLGKRKLVTYVGGLKPFEGLSDLINALRPLLEEDSEVVLVIAGGVVDSDLLAVKNISSTLSCESQIIFTGQLTLQDVANLLSASNVLVLPKTDHPVNHHAMPIKLGEYLASGRPVVSAAIGGITDYIVHEMNGLLYSPGDTNGLRRGIEELLRDDEKAKRIGLAGQQTAFQEFDINIVAQKLATQLARE